MPEHMSNTEAQEAFEDLFKLDVRIDVAGAPMGRCNPTDDGCSGSCPSVGCSATCHCR